MHTWEKKPYDGIFGLMCHKHVHKNGCNGLTFMLFARYGYWLMDISSMEMLLPASRSPFIRPSHAELQLLGTPAG